MRVSISLTVAGQDQKRYHRDDSVVNSTGFDFPIGPLLFTISREMTLQDVFKPGITGVVSIRGKAVGEPISEAAVAGWRKACAEAAARVRLYKLAWHPASVGRNYHRYDFGARVGDRRLAFVLHVTLPFAAAAEPDDEQLGKFVDCELGARLLSPEIRLVPASLLNRRFVFEPWMATALDRGEFALVDFGFVKRVGDLVFNWFD